jgi:alpha-D-ribose 1-methylphosphonate 5-triphosphate synthase subunit PhnH
VRALGLDPVADTRRAFRGLCDAMARPGTVQSVPAPADHAVLATLVDHEVSLATPDEELADALAREGRLVAAAPPEADVVHAVGTPDWEPTELARGSLVEPSEGATAVYRVDEPTEGSTAATAGADTATTVRVRGPGVPGEREATVGLPADHLRALARAQETYPRGVDAVVTGERQVLAFPRSVSLEVA